MLPSMVGGNMSMAWNMNYMKRTRLIDGIYIHSKTQVSRSGLGGHF